MSDDDGPLADATSGTGPGSGGNDGLEPLACVTCRSRKLKCDRVRPACTRCAKFKAECVYPESRRKPASRRRNVKELEDRLAQVEVLLKDAAGRTTVSATNEQQSPLQNQGAHAPRSNGQTASRQDSTFHASIDTSFENDALNPLNWGFPGGDPGVVPEGLPGSGVNETSPDGDGPGHQPAAAGWGNIFTLPSEAHKPRAENAGATNYELLGLGLFESLPPTEMIEELHQTFFVKQHPLIPVVHPGRYIQAFYSAPHLRPPMALQYAIWTMATNGHDKYSAYHDAFHRRCRHYLQEDELRGDGEHFLTVSHAQAWALIATDEARCMWFTRAAMSASRCIKLLHMMGLHRLDDPNAEFEMAPTIAPPKDWTELEERRRVFWGAFAIDSHAAISTGWPTLIDLGDVTTHLPSTEEAFNTCREEKTCRLEDVFTGSPYSSFAGAAVICHLFNQIMKHVHRKRSNDAPENYEYGRYWTRHRELDNLLSSAFMFLPERFRLPQNLRDPVAVNTNLNLHASLICLHNSAFERAHEHNLADHIKQLTKARLFTAAQEIVNIVKMASHTNAGYRSPLVALALYVASSVYVSQAQEDGLSPSNTANFEFLLTAMQGIGRQHIITMSFLRQAIFDAQRAGLQGVVRMPKIDMQPDPRMEVSSCGHNIPLFARSRISKGSGISPPLPGRLPLNKPIGRRRPLMRMSCSATEPNRWDAIKQHVAGGDDTKETGNVNKRRRVNLSPDLASISTELNHGPLSWFSANPVEDVSSSDSTPGTSSMSSSSKNGSATQPPRAADCMNRFRLPHRGGTSTSGSSPSTAMNSSYTPTSSDPSPGQQAAPGTRSSVTEGGIMLTDQTANADLFGMMSDTVTATATAPAAEVVDQNGGVDTNLFQGMNSWDTAGGGPQDASELYAQVAEAMMSDDSWLILNGVGTSSSSSWKTGPEGGTGVG